MLTWITKTPHVIIYLMLTWITQTTTAMTDCLKVIFIYADLDHQDPWCDNLYYADLDHPDHYCYDRLSLGDIYLCWLGSPRPLLLWQIVYNHCLKVIFIYADLDHHVPLWPPRPHMCSFIYADLDHPDHDYYDRLDHQEPWCDNLSFADWWYMCHSSWSSCSSDLCWHKNCNSRGNIKVGLVIHVLEAVIYVDIKIATTQVGIRTLTPTYVHIVAT